MKYMYIHTHICTVDTSTSSTTCTYMYIHVHTYIQAIQTHHQPHVHAYIYMYIHIYRRYRHIINDMYHHDARYPSKWMRRQEETEGARGSERAAAAPSPRGPCLPFSFLLLSFFFFFFFLSEALCCGVRPQYKGARVGCWAEACGCRMTGISFGCCAACARTERRACIHAHVHAHVLLAP